MVQEIENIMNSQIIFLLLIGLMAIIVIKNYWQAFKNLFKKMLKEDGDQ
jgi:high-affinity nickel permease